LSLTRNGVPAVPVSRLETTGTKQLLALLDTFLMGAFEASVLYYKSEAPTAASQLAFFDGNGFKTGTSRDAFDTDTEHHVCSNAHR
jgi:hypothetical protein